MTQIYSQLEDNILYGAHCKHQKINFKTAEMNSVRFFSINTVQWQELRTIYSAYILNKAS